MSLLELHPNLMRWQDPVESPGPQRITQLTDGTEWDHVDPDTKMALQADAAITAANRKRAAGGLMAAARGMQMREHGYSNPGGSYSNPLAHRDPSNFFEDDPPAAGAGLRGMGGGGGEDPFMGALLKSISPATRMRGELGMGGAGAGQERPSFASSPSRKPAGIYTPDDDGNMVAQKTFEPPLGRGQDELAAIIASMPLDQRQQMAQAAVSKRLGISAPQQMSEFDRLKLEMMKEEIASGRDARTRRIKLEDEDRARMLDAESNDPTKIIQRRIAGRLKGGGAAPGGGGGLPRQNFVEQLDQAPYSETADVGGLFPPLLPNAKPSGSGDPFADLSDFERRILKLPTHAQEEQEKLDREMQNTERQLRQSSLKGQLEADERKRTGKMNAGEQQDDDIKALDSLTATQIQAANGDPVKIDAIKRWYMKLRTDIRAGRAFTPDTLPALKTDTSPIAMREKLTKFGYRDESDALSKTVARISGAKGDGWLQKGLKYNPLFPGAAGAATVMSILDASNFEKYAPAAETSLVDEGFHPEEAHAIVERARRRLTGGY